MISQESTTKDVKLVGYDFRGHTRGTLVVGIAYGCMFVCLILVVYSFFKWFYLLFFGVEKAILCNYCSLAFIL